MTTQEGKESENQIMSENKVRIAEMYVSRDAGGKEFDECTDVLVTRLMISHLGKQVANSLEELKSNHTIEAYLLLRDVHDMLHEIAIRNRRVLPMVTEWR